MEVLLPRAVEELLKKICSEQRQPPLNAEVRRRLALRGEEEAMDILRRIAATKIRRSLSGYVKVLLDRSSSPPPPSSSSPSPSSTPPKRPRLSHSPNSAAAPSFSQKNLIVRYLAPPQGVPETVARSLFPEPTRVNGTEEMEALGELEFRKQFLILNYIGSNELQNLLRTEEIRNLKDLQMVEFERKLWERFGGRYADPQDRVVYNDWDRGRTHIYHCHVSPEGHYRFKGPYLDRTKTHLQRVLGDDNVLLVKFAEEMTENSCIASRHPYFAGYSKIAREGILLGLRRYHFFVFKDGGKEDGVKCFFVRTHSDARIDQTSQYKLCNKTISEARHMFMHVRTVPTLAKYMARFSLILSKTLNLLDTVVLSSVKMEIVNDIYCKDEHGDPIYRDGKLLIHTDGTGYISEDLAKRCPKNVYEGICINDKDFEMIHNHDEHVKDVKEKERLGIQMQAPPMLIQSRLFNKGYAIKGTFLVNKRLGPNTIVVRHSMVKVEPDPNPLINDIVNSFEVVGTSNQPNRTCLSRNLIALLSYGGVPDEYFQILLREALREADGAFSNKHTALKVALNRGNTDKDFTIAKMILSGIPLEEPYLQHRLSLLLKEQKMSLRGGKLYVPECYYLMGTADPTGKLRRDEVCIVLENGQVSGKVLVYRNPGIHFGDVHVLKATYVEELDSFVGNSKYAIFFSTQGPRSIADEIAGGDFDGDMYWVSRNSQLLKYFKPTKPWISDPSTSKVESKRPDQLSDEALEDELFKLFLTTKFQPSFAMGEAADSWLALMDRFLTLGDDSIDEKNVVRENILKLINIYYDALDAPRTGVKVEVPKGLRPKLFPHYMEKKKSYTSVSILGKIFDEVNTYLEEDNSYREVWKLPVFDVEVPQDCLNKWSKYYEDYRRKMTNSLKIEERDIKNEAAGDIKRHYRKILYGAEQFEESTRDIEDIYNEALAIYHVCYDYAKNEGKSSLCSFAWSVAGPALYKFYTSKKAGEKAFMCLPSVLREVL